MSAIKVAKPALDAREGFYLLPTQLDLHGADDAAALCMAMPVMAASLVVVDTMARSMGGGDENSSRDVSQFVANIDAIRTQTGAHVLVIHHSGKNAEAGARGSSALRAAIDTEIAITDRQITCAKQRDMEFPNRLFFNLESVELGRDRDGEPVTSAVVVEASATARTAKPLRGREEVAAQALAEALRLYGEKHNRENIPNNRDAVALVRWRDQCEAFGLTEKDATKDAKRKAFDRAKQRLMDHDHIRVWGDFVWKVQADD
ncbi:helicase RepA family protein [Phaeobacter sp. G2]|nr:helicase RepA family protein [Phaeobacter sp. G2]